MGLLYVQSIYLSATVVFSQILLNSSHLTLMSVMTVSIKVQENCLEIIHRT